MASGRFWGLVAGSALLIGAATTAIAAGAILAMLIDIMIPEAFKKTHNFAGLITVVGFLVAFILNKVGK